MAEGFVRKEASSCRLAEVLSEDRTQGVDLIIGGILRATNLERQVYEDISKVYRLPMIDLWMHGTILALGTMQPA